MSQTATRAATNRFATALLIVQVTFIILSCYFGHHQAVVNAQEAPSPKKTNNSSFIKASSFEIDCLEAHNKWRRLHGAPNLVISKKIVQFAQKRANHIASSDGAEFKHPADLPYGENLAWHSVATTGCRALVQMWYDEVTQYKFKNPGFDHNTGHFTQLVWKSTREVGCAKAVSSGPRGGVTLVCNYDPPGNFIGEFKQNVSPKGKTPSKVTKKPLIPSKNLHKAFGKEEERETTTTSGTVSSSESTSPKDISPIPTAAAFKLPLNATSGLPVQASNTTSGLPPSSNKKKNKKIKKNKSKKKKMTTTTKKPDDPSSDDTTADQSASRLQRSLNQSSNKKLNSLTTIST